MIENQEVLFGVLKAHLGFVDEYKESVKRYLDCWNRKAIIVATIYHIPGFEPGYDGFTVDSYGLGQPRTLYFRPSEWNQIVRHCELAMTL